MIQKEIKEALYFIVKNKYGYLVRKNEEIFWISLAEAEKYLLKEEPT